MMTPERWHQIKHLVNSAIAEDAESRPALLQQSCADDLSLRHGAEALLSFHHEETRRLGNAPAGAPAPLSPDRWQRVERLFQSALELEPVERAAFLARACGDDQALRHEVESLLVYQAAAGSLIQGAIHNAAGLLDHSDGHKARFTPGTTLNKRYRIIGLLGRGGMGEVYRADDLKLGQPVALKFLTEQLSKDKAMLARFHSEVAMAHRVTHPNVCRVHDIGEVTTSSGAQHFLSMEYVDGEDLSSLLRRIGRLPADKAVEIATQLCAGLAAAHEAGVLHRDLKPANVMLDGKGRVRITDFGLAGFAEQIKGSEVMAGTPAYMSPEQFAGKEVTTKSDIYALGLVLYEIFTGKRVFEAGSLDELRKMHESSSPPNPSNWVKDIDPLVERVILRCLEKDPGRRLASAKQVADALPGGDPLAAALAMGETPSPEMVAAAGSKTGLRPQVAVACLVAIIVGLLLIAFLNSKVYLTGKLPLENSPDVLAHRAREIISRLGYTARPADTAYGFNYDGDYLQYVRETGDPATRNSRLLKGHPPVIQFWYRESPGYLEANFKPSATREETPFGRVTLNEPPQVISGMTSTVLDPQGWLIAFSAVPPQLDQPSATPQRELKADWTALFSAAGLDEQRFTPAEPEWVPLVACDVRAAWTGVWPEQPEIPLRIEAAAWRGRPVWFQMIGPWSKPERMPTVQPTKVQRFVNSLGVALIAIVLLGAMLFARHNNRQGRGDRRGAFRLACFVFAVQMLAWLSGASHAPTTHEINDIFLAIGRALFAGVLVWMTYLALEPYLRRHWPQPLIAWGRCLEGRFNDPLVGRDILIDILFAIGYELFFLFTFWLNSSLSAAKNPATILGLRYTVAFLAMGIVVSVMNSLGTLFLVFLFRALLRKLWLATGVVILISILSGVAASQWIGILVSYILYITVMVLVLLRFGLISAAVLMLARTELLIRLPLTTNLSVWYTGSSILGMVVLLMLAGYAFHTSLGGQKVFAGKLLDE